MRDFICGYHSLLECGVEVTLFVIFAAIALLLLVGWAFDAAKRKIKAAWKALGGGAR